MWWSRAYFVVVEGILVHSEGILAQKVFFRQKEDHVGQTLALYVGRARYAYDRTINVSASVAIPRPTQQHERISHGSCMHANEQACHGD